MTTDLRRAADWNILVVGLARVQCPYPIAIRSLAFGKIEKIQSDCDDKMYAVLSEEQKKFLDEMKGFPFNFHE